MITDEALTKVLIRRWAHSDATSRLLRRTRKLRILSSVTGARGMPEEDLGLFFTWILRWIMPTKSERRTRPTVEIALLMRAR